MIDSELILRAAGVLERGGLVVMPTDTVYGVAADQCNAEAVALLFEAKRRDGGKPIPLLASDLSVVENCGAVLGPIERALAEAFWPGPLTMVLKCPSFAEASAGARGGVADGTAGREEGREGFRVPACDDALALLRAAGGLLRVTSANLSGEPPALTAGAAARELRDFVDMVLDAGPARGGTPSTVVEVRESKIRVLREGAVSLQELEGQT